MNLFFKDTDFFSVFLLGLFHAFLVSLLTFRASTLLLLTSELTRAGFISHGLHTFGMSLCSLLRPLLPFSREFGL